MSQFSSVKSRFSSNSCDCNDLAKFKANTGIAFINTANPNRDGSGSITTVFTGATNGSYVKSVIVKATQPTTTGMVCLYIKRSSKNVLFKEISIPVMPSLFSTPTPSPTLPTFVAYVVCDIALEAGDLLTASTQNGEGFNIIAEGLDLSYQDNPTSCCNFKQTYPNIGMDIVYVANPNLDGTGSISSILTANSSKLGTNINSISIEALQSTNKGMVRLFISPDGGTTFYLMNEIMIPVSVQSAFIPSFKALLPQNYNIQAGYILGVSTQNNESFGVTILGESWNYAY